MKRPASIILLSLTLVSCAQGQTPTADQVRQRIAQGVTQLKGPPAPVGTVENWFVRTATDCYRIRGGSVRSGAPTTRP